ncbi:MAG: ABC transporter ATP-binding protein [Rhodocyclaceae bacterium]|nr:ABC transporter ATP-binding protein [Rhodocyclaceae bacterium]MDZ4214763.1 ABC transporter ATP-binding protein [Rhodocyclaceae bacterium]
MIEDIAISVRNLTKTYRFFGHPGDRVKQFFSLGLKQYHREFTALKDVSFDIKKGETVGIIGRNGSGKSTLLQLICGILKPTSGIVQVNGRISALLELGAGFNPEFTGRENVYFQGALMGFSKEQIHERFDEIAAFADIGEFIDQPVRTYSSGMFVRLAFAVSAHVDPDILIVDEALSVGDATFQHKCMQRMEKMIGERRNLIIVSHDINAIKSLCQRTLLLHQGILLANDSSGKVCDDYLRTALTQQSSGTPLGPTKASDQDCSRDIVAIDFVEIDSNPARVYCFGEDICLRIGYKAHEAVNNLVVSFYIKNIQQLEVLGTNSAYEGIAIGPLVPEENGCVEFRFKNSLRNGTYSVTAILSDREVHTLHFYDWLDNACYFESQDPPNQPRWAFTCPDVSVNLTVLKSTNSEIQHKPTQ